MKLILVIGPDHDDYYIIKTSSIVKAKKKFAKYVGATIEFVEDQVEFIKVDVI